MTRSEEFNKNSNRFGSILSSIRRDWAALSWFEKYGFITGAIGLIADAQSLLPSLFGNQSPSVSEDLNTAITGLIIPYGWLAVAWTFTRSGLSRISDESYRRHYISSYAARSVAGLGILIAPLVLAWLRAAFHSDVATVPVGIVLISVCLILGAAIYNSIALLMPLCYNDLVVRRSSRTVLRSPSRATLIILQGANAGRQYRFASQVTVGRDPQFCDLPLYDEYVTNPQFSIQMRQNQFLITDKGSTNGTRVNGISISPHQPVLLQPGAIIEVGKTRLEFKRIKPRLGSGS